MFELNDTVVEMYTIWLSYVVFYTHPIIEGIAFILIVVGWGLYEANGIFTSVECGIVLLFYTAFAVAIGFLFYSHYHYTILYYDPEIRADYEA